MKVTVTTKELLDAIKTVEGSLDIKQNNIISNVCIKIKSYYIELVATDGNSLTMVRINPECEELWDKNLINKEFLFNIDSIKRAIDKTSKTVELDFNYIDNNKTMIVSNNGLSATLLSDVGNYPKYEQLMPYNDNYKEIKRDDREFVRIGVTKKYLLDILKSYDNKIDEIIEFEISKDNLKYIGIQPIGINNGKKFTMLMPVNLRQ